MSKPTSPGVTECQAKITEYVGKITKVVDECAELVSESNNKTMIMMVSMGMLSAHVVLTNIRDGLQSLKVESAEPSEAGKAN